MNTPAAGVPARAAAPPRLWWVYVLVGTALAVIGAGAGQVLSITLDLGDVAPSHACLVRNGISVYGGDPVTLDQAAYGSCMGDYSRVQALAALAGAVALPVTAWLLMLVGGIGTRWRLRPGRIAGAPAASQRLADRFAVLCDSQGLTGRNRPRLVPAPPGTGVTQAFTTGLPGTRPWVVVPLAYAYTDPAAFDAVAVHELGHVRSRDVLWASAVWWAGWLAVPALLLALLPLAGIPAVVWELYGGALVAAVVVALVMFVLRAGLLRRRELAADRHVLEVTADPTALTALIRPSGKRRAGVFATHPTAADRLALDPDAREREGGFVFTAAVGVVAMAAYHVVFTASTSLQWTIDTDTTTWAPVVAALLWASVVVPAWTGRAMSGPSGWTGPLAGAVVGLVVGYFLQPPGVITTIVALSGRGLLLSVPGLVVIAFAVALLTAGMATRLARHNRPRLGGFGAVLAVTAALAAAWGTITSAAVIHVAIGGVESIRWLLVVNGHHGIWRYTAALALVGLALVVPRSHLRGPVPAVIGMAAVTGGTASALSWYSRSGGDLSDPRNGFLTYQAWWVCALAGLVTAVVVAVVNGGALSAAPTSVLCGLLAAASAGAVQYAVLRFGYGVRSDLFRGTLQQPGWLLLLALIGTTPLTALLAAAVRRPQPRRGAVRWATGTAGLTALLALLLVAGGLTSVTVAERDLSDLATPSAAAKTPPVAPANTPRPLDQDAATAALADVPAVLPPGAQNVPTLPDSSSTRTPATCDEAVKRATVNEKALPRTAEVEQRFTFPMGDIPNGAGIRVAVTSYSAAHPGFADLDAENQACANFRQRSTEGNGYLDCYITPRPASDFPLARKRTLTALGQVKGTALVVTIHHYAAIFGSTRIDVAVDWFYLATAPPQAVLDETDRLVTSAMNVIAVKL